jgi:hypothetical protein
LHGDLLNQNSVALQIAINQVRWQHLAAAASYALWFAVVRGCLGVLV